MVAFVKLLFRHYKLSTAGAILGANLVCVVPLLLALFVPIVVASNLAAGMVVLLTGLVLTGQALAVSGRLLDLRFQGTKLAAGRLWSCWAAAWAEGLVVAAVLIGLFSLAFNSVPFYWSQGTAFSAFSLVTLGVGTALVLAALPYYLPVRRREGLGVVAALVRSFRLMNERPVLALTGVGFGVLLLLANLGTAGLFPGLAGLAAFHQGLYEAAVAPRTPKLT
jgi:hypothetical protein